MNPRHAKPEDRELLQRIAKSGESAAEKAAREQATKDAATKAARTARKLAAKRGK